MPSNDLSADQLRTLLAYDPESGVFTRRVRTSNRIKVGDKVGCYREVDGYLCARVGNRLHLMHRLAWLYVYGEWPSRNIDHINGIGTDNRIANLREANHEENAQNIAAHKDNRTGLLGVTWSEAAGGFLARIHSAGITHRLGIFSTAEEAHQAYCAAKKKIHTFQPVPRNA